MERFHSVSLSASFMMLAAALMVGVGSLGGPLGFYSMVAGVVVGFPAFLYWLKAMAIWERERKSGGDAE